MKKNPRLKYQPEADFRIIGIVSSESISRLSWLINKYVKILLVQYPDLEIFNSKLETMQKFNVFGHENIQGSIMYRLVKNQSENGSLSPKNKGFDYFLQCVKESEEELLILKNKLKKIDNIQLVNVVDASYKDLFHKMLI